MNCPQCGRKLDEAHGKCPVCQSGGDAEPVVQPVRMPAVKCRVCGTDNTMPGSPQRCANPDCRAVILPDGRSGIPHSYVRQDLATSGVWLVALGVISVLARPLSTRFGVLLIIAGALLLLVRTRSMYLVGALLGYAAGIANAAVALSARNLLAGLLAVFCFWAATSWLRSYRSLEFTVDA